MAAALKCFITHIFSNAPTAKTTGTITGIASPGVGIFDTNKDFVALGVVVGDVFRYTGGNHKQQAAVIKTVAATALTFYTALAGRPDLSEPDAAVGTAYRIEAARQATDVTNDVMSADVKDYMSELTSQVIIELANTNHKYEGLFAARDPVEVWIDDGDAASAAPTMPSSTTDTATTVENSRAFVGRIDRIERDTTEQGEILRLACRDYAGDLLDLSIDAVFIRHALIGSAGESVAERLQALLNGIKAQIPSEDDIEWRAGRLGRMRDRATGRPSFALAVSSVNVGIPTGDVAFVSESVFNAYARLAGACEDQTVGMFKGEPCKLWVDSWTYHPRRQDRVGAGEDDPRAEPGANTSGSGNPTINIKTPTDAKGSAVGWNISEGTNVIALRPQQDTERTRNTILALGKRSDGVPIALTTKQSGSFEDAHKQPVLGRDRYGELGGTSRPSGFYDNAAADAAAKAALIRTRSAKERRTIPRTLILEPGRRLSGAVVSVQAVSAGLSVATDLGIAGVRHLWRAAGLVSEFDVTHIRPGWDRLLAPLQTSVRETIREDVWDGWWLYVADYNTGSGNVEVFRVPAHEWGSSPSTEVKLFTVTRPSKATYATNNDDEWRFAGFSFHAGLLCLLWYDPHDTAGEEAAAITDRRILFQIVNAYDGSAWQGGAAGSALDGVYAFAADGVARITFQGLADQAGASGAARIPSGVWFHGHTDVTDNLAVPPIFDFLVGNREGVYVRYRLRRFGIAAPALRQFDKSGRWRTVMTNIDTANAGPGRFFLEERDDGHRVVHTSYVSSAAPAAKEAWATADLDSAQEPAVGAVADITPEKGELTNTAQAATIKAMTSDRFNGIAAYVRGTLGTSADNVLKADARWGDLAAERPLGSSTRTFDSNALAPRDDVDLVPLARFYFR